MILMTATASWACSTPGEQATVKPTRPNIVLFVTDDQGADAGCYGNPTIITPGLDTLAAEGTRFTHAFCSTSSCSASRSTILTGLHNHKNGQYGHAHMWFHFQTYDTIRSLPVLLSEEGYQTIRAGKYHVAPEEVYAFDHEIPKTSPEGMADRFGEFLESSGEEPFFFYFCTHEPHGPFNRKGSREISPDDVIVPSHVPDIPEMREKLAHYYMSTERADKGINRLIEILKESGRWENTVVMATSDNGRPFPGGKMNMWEPGIRLPFIVYDPGAEKRNMASDAMISFVDIMPTILDYAGVKFTDYPLHGRSFRDQVEVEQSNGWDTIYCSHNFHETIMYYPMRVVRTRKYKLIWNIEYERNFRRSLGARRFADFIERTDLDTLGRRSLKEFLYRPEFELYDLENDPDEINNLAYDPVHRELFENLKQEIFDFQNETGDGWAIAQDFHLLRELVE